MIRKFGFDFENNGKFLKVFKYRMIWLDLCFESFFDCREKNGFEEVNLEEGVVII